MSSSGANGKPVVLVSAAMFLLSGGENLWRKFLPKYLQALGAPIRAVGFYGSLEDFLDGIYQYPGGFLGDHLGRRKALLLFVALAMIGYAIYAAAPAWTWAIIALVFAMAWSSMASPTLFAVVGDALPKERRALGFTLQAVLRRVPILFAPIVGGIVIARVGVVRGVQILCAVTFVLGALTLVVVSRVRIEKIAGAPANIRGVWRAMPQPLRWLLLSDVFIRTCEGLVDEFVVIWAMSIAGLTAPQYGALIAVQTATSIAVYLPAAKIADRIGRKPVVIVTFLCFSLFPAAVVAAPAFKTMLAAFVVGGLREIGEPARKALIVDLAQPVLRARTVGLYYLIRSVAITPAAFIGGLLWERQPSLPFLFAMGVGLFGTLLFALTVDEGGL
ncbi:MAG TPA: MFS transporter [Thermoanaerobaculia bacterium]|jgi:MFS family permease